MQASLAVSMLLLLKKFLREAYRLADDRVASYAGMFFLCLVSSLVWCLAFFSSTDAWLSFVATAQLTSLAETSVKLHPHKGLILIILSRRSWGHSAGHQSESGGEGEREQGEAVHNYLC